jgi:hypothetical protein
VVDGSASAVQPGTAAAASACSAAVVGVHGGGRLRTAGVHQPRPRSAHTDRCVHGSDRWCPPAVPTWPGTPGGVRGSGHHDRVRCASTIAADCWQDGRYPPRTGHSPPEQGGEHGGRRQPTIPTRPARDGSGRQPPHAGSAAAGPTSDAGDRPDEVSAARRAATSRTLRQGPLCLRNCGRWRCRPDGWCPPRTRPQAAGVRRYRN